jgi:hypothetical protein
MINSCEKAENEKSTKIQTVWETTKTNKSLRKKIKVWESTKTFENRTNENKKV